MIMKDNAQALALIARQLGGEVIRGRVRYLGPDRGVHVGDVHIGDLLHELNEQEVVVIIAPLGPPQESPLLCHVCGTEYESGECPICKAEGEEADRVVEETLRWIERRNTD